MNLANGSIYWNKIEWRNQQWRQHDDKGSGNYLNKN